MSRNFLTAMHVCHAAINVPLQRSILAFVTAWRRHLRYQRGELVRPPSSLLRVAHIDIALARPVPNQLDGEEYGSFDQYAVEVLPQALRINL